MGVKHGIVVSGMVFLLIFSFLNDAFAEIKEVEIKIDGLSCPFCVWGLKKQMKKIKNIEVLDISLKKSMAKVTLKKGSMLDIKDYKDAVKDSGFSIREISVAAEGGIESYGDFLALKVSGTDQLFILDNTKEIQPGSNVLIKGVVHQHVKDKPYGLTIEKVELIEE